MKKYAVIILISIFAFSLISSYNNSKEVKISSDVLKRFNSGEEKVKVIVRINDSSKKNKIFNFGNIPQQKNYEDLIKDKISKDKIKNSFRNSFTVELSKKDLEKLKFDKDIIEIVESKEIKLFLQDAVNIMNVTETRSIQISSINLTGISQAVCVIDTGINYSHPDLGGCSETTFLNGECAKVIGGWDFNTGTQDNNPMDYNGHGTHVSGIVGANGIISGIALDTKIVAVKVFDDNGVGGNTLVLANAIQWCVDNSSIYNISVITMSLGFAENYTSYCDADYPQITTSINNANEKNISVVVATGNDGNYSAISPPSCIQNAIPVASSTKVVEGVSDFSNRNNLVKLFATGSNINSTYLGGGYLSQSGTSMATPMVAGAIAIINQFLDLQEITKTPQEIETILNNTGKLIDDSLGSGLNFSRIDIYSALLSIDSSAPTVNLISPEDNHFNFTQNITFKCSANDVLLSNITLYVWNSTALYNTTFREIAGTNAVAEFNLTNIPNENYQWNCLAYDHNNNFSFASSNYTLTLKEIDTILNSPTNNTFTNQQEQIFNCSSQTISSKELTNITFYLWNSTELIYNLTKNISGTINSTIFNYNLTNETSYYWNCITYNNESSFDIFTNNYTLIYETIKPNLTLIEPFPEDATSNSASKTFYYNVTDNYGISNCSLIIDNEISLTNYSINSSLTNNFTKTLSPKIYNWQINCTDFAGNIENSSTQSFTITAPTIIISSSGGGGGSSSIKTYVALPQQTSIGYTKELRKNDKIKFTISNEITNQHTITTNYIGIDYVDITIQSNPINFVLYIGEEKKLNLTSSEYYNFYIKLNSIKNQKANLTIQTIYEQIFQEPIEIPENKTITGKTIEEKETDKPKIFKIESLKTYLIIILIIFAIFLLIIKKQRNKNKNETIEAKCTRK